MNTRAERPNTNRHGPTEIPEPPKSRRPGSWSIGEMRILAPTVAAKDLLGTQAGHPAVWATTHRLAAGPPNAGLSGFRVPPKVTVILRWTLATNSPARVEQWIDGRGWTLVWENLPCVRTHKERVSDADIASWQREIDYLADKADQILHPLRRS